MSLKDFVKRQLAKEYNVLLEDVESIFQSSQGTVIQNMDELQAHLNMSDFQSIAQKSSELQEKLSKMGLEEAAELAGKLQDTANKNYEQDMQKYYQDLQEKIKPLY
jgi:hypothetical protein